MEKDINTNINRDYLILQLNKKFIILLKIILIIEYNFYKYILVYFLVIFQQSL